MAGDRSGLVTGAVVPGPCASIRWAGLPAGVTHNALFSLPSRRWWRCGKGGMLSPAARFWTLGQSPTPISRRKVLITLALTA
jgi:hypothetical protein